VQGVIPFLLLPETEAELAALQSSRNQPEEETAEGKVTHEASSHGPAATATPTTTPTPDQKTPAAQVNFLCISSFSLLSFFRSLSPLPSSPLRSLQSMISTVREREEKEKERKRERKRVLGAH